MDERCGAMRLRRVPKFLKSLDGSMLLGRKRCDKTRKKFGKCPGIRKSTRTCSKYMNRIYM